MLPRERAFTMIELIVVSVLLSIVVLVGARMVLSSISASSSSDAGQRAQADANELLETMGAELRAAASPLRMDPQEISTRDDLRKSLGIASAHKPAVDKSEALADLTVATPTQLVFRTEALAGGGPPGGECVSYSVVPRTSGGFELRRAVRRPALSCPSSAAPLQNRRVATFATATTAPNVFSYFVYRPVTDAVTRSTHCDRSQVATVATTDDRARIVGVGVDLASVLKSGQEAGGQELRTELSMASRLTDDYQYAIGCMG